MNCSLQHAVVETIQLVCLGNTGELSSMCCILMISIFYTFILILEKSPCAKQAMFVLYKHISSGKNWLSPNYCQASLELVYNKNVLKYCLHNPIGKRAILYFPFRKKHY